MSSALDRAKVSDRNATYVIASVTKSLGHDAANLTLNKESIRKARQKSRQAIIKEIHASFNSGTPLTVHWDGKMLPEVMSIEKVDRLAVLVSGDGVMKLLGVPKILNGTGKLQAQAVFQLLEDWNLCERVQSMCFDTTASNTGPKNGACVLLEELLQKDLVSLACRHHIMEMLVSKVFAAVMEKATSGPDIELFKKFRDSWSGMNKTAYESGMTDQTVALALEPVKSDIVNFIHCQLSTFQPRDDYKELLQLALLFLGEQGNTSQVQRINMPGAFHRARWMAKLIYCLKIFLFRSQFRLTTTELEGMREFNIFVIKVYLKAWYTSPIPLEAPRNDLQLLNDLAAYKTTNPIVAKAALKSFSGHLWYLSETLIALGFFDSEIPVETKAKMAEALKIEGTHTPVRRISLEEDSILSKQLWNFVSANTKEFFTKMDIRQEFLQEYPSFWERNEDYMEAQRRLKNLKVVNDISERGVSLMQEFSAILTYQEEQKQFLLQVVEKHRKEVPTSRKSTIVAALSKKLIYYLEELTTDSC